MSTLTRYPLATVHNPPPYDCSRQLGSCPVSGVSLDCDCEATTGICQAAAPEYDSTYGFYIASLQ